eukprot:6042182-Heterocapsa_arctica.AAC.2
MLGYAKQSNLRSATKRKHVLLKSTWPASKDGEQKGFGSFFVTLNIIFLERCNSQVAFGLAGTRQDELQTPTSMDAKQLGVLAGAGSGGNASSARRAWGVSRCTAHAMSARG